MHCTQNSLSTPCWLREATPPWQQLSFFISISISCVAQSRQASGQDSRQSITSSPCATSSIQPASQSALCTLALWTSKRLMTLSSIIFCGTGWSPLGWALYAGGHQVSVFQWNALNEGSWHGWAAPASADGCASRVPTQPHSLCSVL